MDDPVDQDTDVVRDADEKNNHSISDLHVPRKRANSHQSLQL